MAKDYTFQNTIPLAPLKIIAMPNCADFGRTVDRYIVGFRREDEEVRSQRQSNLDFLGYDCDSYLVQAVCPRFGSGEAKGVITESVRGSDLYILTDVMNYHMTFPLYGREHHMSPDDHFQDLKRIVSIAVSSAHRVNVIIPFLYESRQHKRKDRESLDCALSLEELAHMGVSNIITFDAHDARVQNAIPLHDFDSFPAVYQFMKALLGHDRNIPIDKDSLMIISPDEGSMGRSVYLANNLGVDLGMFYRRRDYSRMEHGVNPVVSHEFLGPDVEGKTVIIVDDMISTGEQMLVVARELQKRHAKRIIMYCTFGLFTSGLDQFDRFYAEGSFDYVITTNLTYRDPELLKRPWYLEADMTKYVATIINTLNHDVSLTGVMSHTEKLQKLFSNYKSL